MRVLITVNGHSGVLFIIFNTPCLKNGKRHTQCLNSRKVSHGTESQYPLPKLYPIDDSCMTRFLALLTHFLGILAHFLEICKYG